MKINTQIAHFEKRFLVYRKNIHHYWKCFFRFNNIFILTKMVKNMI